MSLQTSFLTLSIKDQICILIIFLTLFSIIVILGLCCSFSYEILKEDYNQKKLYFYDTYKEYIESCFYFQNFHLLQYEEVIKRMQKQIWKFHQTSKIYQLQSNFYNYDFDVIEIFTPYLHENFTKKLTPKNSIILFFMCFYNYEGIIINQMCSYIRMNLYQQYPGLSSMFITHDIEEGIRIPGYNTPILTSPLMVNVNRSAIYSFNASKIYENVITICGGKNIDITKMDTYHKKKAEKILNYVYSIILIYASTKELFLFEQMFSKIINEVQETDEFKKLDIGNPQSILQFSRETSGYYSKIDYSNDQFSLISFLDGEFNYFETNIINNYLYFINSRLYESLDISFVPLFSENNTVLSPELCILFMIKQAGYDIGKDKIDELNKKIIKGKSTIKDCFIDLNIFKKQKEINDIFGSNFSSFLNVNNRVNQGMINFGKYPLYFFKYAYPNYNVLKEFRSDYLLLDQIDFYFFVSFRKPVEYSNILLVNFRYVFYLTVVIVIYIWIICLFINYIIYKRVIQQLIEPIKNLKEAIETSSVKDQNIFKYEFDDFINDLFLTSKELLLGQIEKNNNVFGHGQFNILSTSKDNHKYIDENIYKKNLLINNEIINQLMDEQLNMNDFSKNIKVNEELLNNNEKEKTKNKSRNIDNQLMEDDNMAFISTEQNEKKNSFNQNEFKYEKGSNENIQKIEENENIQKNGKIENIKESEENDREPYRKLFQISDYLLHYKSKKENNKINIVSSFTKNENQKTNSNNSEINNTKNKKDGKKDNNTSITINMLDNKNLFYLWYMEAKKNNNISINYNMGKNYNELFIDYNPYTFISTNDE